MRKESEGIELLIYFAHINITLLYCFEIKISNKGVNVKISHHNTFLKKGVTTTWLQYEKISFLYFELRNFPRAARGNPVDGSAVGTDFVG